MIIPTGNDPPLAARLRRPAAGLYCIEANSHVAPPNRYLSGTGQLLEHAPLLRARPARPDRTIAAPTARGSRSTQASWRRPERCSAACYVYAHHPFDVVGWDGCLYPYALNVSRLRAADRPGPPASAVHQVFEGDGLRRLQLRAPQGRLPPAVDPGAVLPLERRQRRGASSTAPATTRRAKARESGQGSVSLHPGRPHPWAPAGRAGAQHRCGLTSTSWR